MCTFECPASTQVGVNLNSNCGTGSLLRTTCVVELQATCGSSLAKNDYHNYQYRPWSTSVVDLREHVGRIVTLSVEVHDCLVRCPTSNPYNPLIVPGGHEAYGYFRAEATSYKLNAMICNGNDLELTAPTGYARYEWRSSLGDAPVVRDVNEPNKAFLDPTRMLI